MTSTPIAPKIVMPNSGLPPVPEGQQPVDRTRRFKLIWAVVMYCITASVGFTLLAAFDFVAAVHFSLVANFVDAAMSLAAASTLAYVTGSVVDYNGGIGGILSPRRFAAPDSAAKG